MTWTDTIGAVLMTTTGGRTNRTESLIGNPGMAVVSQTVFIHSQDLSCCFFLLCTLIG